jgi:hypothetical protein
LASELQSVDIKQLLGALLLFLKFLLFESFFLVVVFGFLDFFLLFLFLSGSHVLEDGRLFQNISCESVFVIELSCEGTRIALACDDVVDHDHMHFGEFAFGTANVLLDELVQTLEHFGIWELSVDDVVCIIFSTCLFEGGLGSLFKSEKLQNVLRIRSQVFSDIIQVYDVGLDSITFRLNF